jgi:hypothetical protein
MNKKMLKISGIIFLFVFSTIAIPVIAEQEYEEKFSVTKITAIGTFTRCDEDKMVYGHIFIGLNGNKPVFNTNIEISTGGIGLIIMTKHFLHCVVNE